MRSPDEIIEIGFGRSFRLGSVAAGLYMYSSETEEPITLDSTAQFLGGLRRLLERLNDIHITASEEWSDTSIQYEFYEAAKATFGEDKMSIRRFFRYLYFMVFERADGPRWGQFVAIVGLDKFMDQLHVPVPLI